MKRHFSHIIIALALALGTPAVAAPPVQAPVEVQATVSAGSGYLELAASGEGSVRFHIYSITGQLVRSVDVAPSGSALVELPQGCYIVKCRYWSRKVVVK